MSGRVALCRALHTYHYLDLWRGFLHGLGCEVVLSRPTDRAIVDAGVRIAPAELCLPVKAFLGHVLSLAGTADALFLPRIVCRKVGRELRFGCPKAMALPDMVRALIHPLPPVVELNLDERLESEGRSFERAAKALGRSASDGRRAYRQALASFRHSAGDETTACTPSLAWTPAVADRSGRPVRIAVVGHPYLLYDRALSLDLLEKLGRVGAEPVVVRGANGREPGAARPEFLPNWMNEVGLIHGALAPDGARPYDGVLLASSFACGTSAVTHEIIHHALEDRWPTLPVLTLMLDEYTAEAGLLTRIESFVELIRLRGGKHGSGKPPGTPRAGADEPQRTPRAPSQDPEVPPRGEHGGRERSLPQRHGDSEFRSRSLTPDPRPLNPGLQRIPDPGPRTQPPIRNPR